MKRLLLAAALGASFLFLTLPSVVRAANYTLVDLGTLGGTSSAGWFINSSGQIAGYSDITGDVATHAILVDGNNMQDLGTLGGTNSRGFSVNDAGQVAGWSDTSGNEAQRAILYSGGSMQDLGTLGGTNSYGTDINDSGQVVG